MAIQTIRTYKCDLAKGTTEVNLRAPLMQDDALADRFEVSVVRNGSAVNLAGMTVRGALYLPMEQQTILLAGEASGNVAAVTLDSSCYQHPGHASLVIQVMAGDVRHTLLKVDMTISKTGTDVIIDPQGVIPTLTDVLAKIAEVEQATAAAHAKIAEVDAETAEAIEASNKATAAANTAAAELATIAAPAITPTATGNIVTVTDASDRPAVSVISHIEPVQEGSGDPSPDNVRPFKPWNSETLDVTNENLLGGMHLAEILQEQAGATIDTSAGTVRFTSSGGGNRTLIGKNAFKPGKRYTVVLYGRNIGGRYAAANIAIGYTDGTYDGLNFTSLTENSYVVATSQNGKDVSKIFAIIAADTTDLYYDKCGVFEGVVTADALVPANGKRYSAALPETMHGVDIDWIMGKAYKRYHKITMDGVTSGLKVDTTDYDGAPYAYIHYSTIPKPIKNGGNAYANKLPSISTNSVIAFALPTELTGVTSTDSVSAVVSKYNAVLKQWYDAGSPLEIVYEVETPEEIQLTPQQISTTKGICNAWSDTGDTTLTYIADTKMYIDQRISALLNATID